MIKTKTYILSEVPYNRLPVLGGIILDSDNVGQRYKCYVCKLIFNNEHVITKKTESTNGPFKSVRDVVVCPICNNELLKMCRLDHNHCHHEIIPTIAYCPECGEAICPECGSHDVVQISRVTGYYQETSGWNLGKQQELKDRTRYNV